MPFMLKRPAGASAAEGEGEVAKRPAASGKAAAKAKAKGFIDWAAADSEAVEERSGGGSGRIRMKRKTIVGGTDAAGEALPDDDSSSYTRAQKYVFDKTRSKLGEAFQKKYQEAVDQKNMGEQRRLINSIIPKDAGFNYDIDLGSSQAQEWMKKVSGFQEQSRTHEAMGMSYTEMISKLGGPDQLQEGIRKGDIVEEDGFFFWQRRKFVKTQGRRESSSASWKGELKDEQVGDFLKAINAYTDNAGFIQWVEEKPSGKKQVKMEAEAASELGYQNLQDGFDALAQCQQSVQKLCRSFPRGSMSTTVRGLVGRAMELDLGVGKHLSVMQGLLTNLDGNTTDEKITGALKGAIVDFQKLAEAEIELKGLSKSVKVKG